MADRDGAPISAFITNLGKYNEGDLVGKWHPFPTTTEKIQSTLKEIGVDGVRYEELFITDCETTINGLHDHLPEHANLDELNCLAVKLEELQGYEVDIYEVIIEAGEYCNSMEDLGCYYVEDAGIYDTKAMESLANYIDYEKFGRDVRLEEGGSSNNMGYLASRDGFNYEYGGIEDIPDEHKVFAFPEREPKERSSVMDKLSAAKEVVAKGGTEKKPDTPKKSHDAEL